MSVATVVGDINEFLPFVDTIVTGIEGLFSKKNSGTQKKAIAMSTLTSTLSAIGLVAPGTTTVAPALEAAASTLVDDIVKWKNLTGAFTTTGANQPVVTAVGN